MKKILMIGAMIAALSATACTSQTSFGDCIGVDDTEDPALKYSVDTGNVILGVVFIETIFVPAVVLLDEFKCPTGKRFSPPDAPLQD